MADISDPNQSAASDAPQTTDTPVFLPNQSGPTSTIAELLRPGADTPDEQKTSPPLTLEPPEKTTPPEDHLVIAAFAPSDENNHDIPSLSDQEKPTGAPHSDVPRPTSSGKRMKSIAVAIILFLFLGAGTYVISQPQIIADLRGLAKECVTDDCSVSITRGGKVIYDERLDTSKVAKDRVSENEKIAEDLKEEAVLGKHPLDGVDIRKVGTTPQPGQINCSGRYVDPQTDSTNCGACGRGCGSGSNCYAGACITPGRIVCSGREVDPQTDSTNCGACGRGCGSGSSCFAGACISTAVALTTSTNGGSEDDTPSDNTPTPTGVTPQCNDIKIYKDGSIVTPSTLQPGQAVVIAIAGGNATKARVRVNSKALDGTDSWTESTAQNANGEYTFSYTIPETVTNFSVQGEIFGSDSLWH